MDILIIEDDKWTENSLVYLLKKNFKSINSISCANTIVKAKNHLLRKNTDLVFADVELGKDIVFELIKEMNLKFPYLIIISSHKKYALESIRYNAIDYLLKPIEINALTLAYKKVEKRNKANLFNDKQHPKSLFIGIKENKKIKIINFSDIIYLKKKLNRTYFQLSNNDEIVSNVPINKYLKILPEDFFLKVHPSYIVNIKSIKTVNIKNRDYKLVTSKDHVVPINPSYMSKILNNLKKKILW